MQIISRQVNEGIQIGEDVSVTVLNICDDHVRLGLSSPNEQPAYWEQTLYWEPAEATREYQMN